MTMATPEFSRLIRRDEIGRLGESLHIVANGDERAALAARFGFVSLNRLEATYGLSLDGEVVTAQGRISAALAQPCIATAEPVTETVDTPFLVRFMPEGSDEPEPGDELELDVEECDTVTYTDGRIDIGEAVAETLALSVNPFPRSPDADSYLRQMGVLSEEEAQEASSPFAALKALKPK
ncbi:YceD family protein [Sphingobium subterraneum]|uniref:Uncharacterized metal-binding protein YceD (DUF177 family) n=1 Tax=Sphingobium subterraneum TaxID=627688 RepID=A0A841J2K2_9SPHN|nr:DUF177 domain-containing protein [Sphingobium subterraneum]MBB6125183.1 uncharacterized metal-binding protein YceD (DUF177 family) [Sphingobium subterraneum]